MSDAGAEWIALAPPLKGAVARSVFLAQGRQLSKVSTAGSEFDSNVDHIRQVFNNSTKRLRSKEKDVVIAAGLLLNDLRKQGWECRVRGGVVEIQPPTASTADLPTEKERIRRQELLRRDAQLEEKSVREFVSSMELSRRFGDKAVSIFSLMRDGRELVSALRAARAHNNNGWADALKSAVDPYIQVVESQDHTCNLTGIRLMHIWRYFRHTWTNQHTSVPGRSMMFLVRDRSHPYHAVVGIGALASPIVQIRVRDDWIGWQAEQVIRTAREQPTAEIARWLTKVIDRAISEIYVEDFIEQGIICTRDLAHPSDSAIKRLIDVSSAQRKKHRRFARARDHKGYIAADPASRSAWIAKARMHLFRSKRALALATYLDCRLKLRGAFGSRATAKKLRQFAETTDGSDVIRRIVRKAKADRVGIAMADISVCGAIQPYNAILGGKLVAMLAASPQIVDEYRRRYFGAQSEIASAMAGRPIVRTPTLVFLGTTSLYGRSSSQYNRVHVPCDRLGGAREDSVIYRELGTSEAFGTSQYSDETIDALTRLVHQRSGGERINSIFGEGVSPKLRKVRAGIEALGFPASSLLRHYRSRKVYGVSLVENLSRYLLGMDAKPKFLFSLESPSLRTEAIAAWWRERWLRNRIKSDDVLERTEAHTLVRPIRHGARVVITDESSAEGRGGISRQQPRPEA